MTRRFIRSGKKRNIKIAYLLLRTESLYLVKIKRGILKP